METIKKSFRVSENDLSLKNYTKKEIEAFFELQQEMAKSGRASIFYKNAVIERSEFTIRGTEEQYLRLLELVRVKGIDKILDILEGDNIPSATLSAEMVNEIANSLIENLKKNGGLTIESIQSSKKETIQATVEEVNDDDLDFLTEAFSE